MSEASKVTQFVAVGPANNNVAASKAVLYVAYTTTAVTPARKRIHGRIRYVGPLP